MPVVSEQEVKPGLVVHLDTDELRKIGGSLTNAEVAMTGDRAVVGPHYFLVVEVDGPMATAVPLFSKCALGSEPLHEKHKAGLADKWIGERSYFSRWQHWQIPIAAVAAASATEESDQTNRRQYAASKPAVLQTIAVWQGKNRAKFRAP